MSDTRLEEEEKELEDVKLTESGVMVDSVDETQGKSVQTSPVNIKPATSNNEENSTNLNELFNYYVDRTSMHGLSLLVGSNNRIVKVIWTLIILASILEVCLHFSSLVNKYLEYSTRTEILIGFSTLQFPAVTICNVNVMRKAMVPGLVAMISEGAENSQLFENNTVANEIKENDKLGLKVSNTNKKPYSDLENKYYGKLDPGSWEAVANKSESYVLTDTIKTLYGSFNVSVQKAIGHQAEQMILSCSFSTRDCFRNFKQRTNADFGNCYTIEDTRFISKQSGPLGGLEIILDLETEQYVPYLSPAKGAQIVIHAPNTVPIPFDEGFTIPAGQQVMIGLKEIRITRLGEPYSPCNKDDEYKKLYNVTYTRNLCQKICYLKRVADQCKCEDTEHHHINEIMKLNINKSCLVGEASMECVIRIKNSFKADDPKCQCLNPCRETTFDLQTGYRLWPNRDSLAALIKGLCQTMPEKCEEYKQQSPTELRENFLLLNIYYRDLNFEQLMEQKNYEFSQLLSDFGGSLGLFIGLSFMSLLELAHMFLGLLRYLLCKYKRKP